MERTELVVVSTVRSKGAGHLLKTVDTVFSSTTGDPYGTGITAFNIVPIRVTTTWPNGQVKKTEQDFDGGITMTGDAAGYKALYGNVVEGREYDYGNGSPGGLLRQTKTQYLAFSNNNYLTTNLLDLPSSVQVLNGSGSQQAYTTFGYDGAIPQSSGVTEQKIAGEAYPGNQTSVSRWLSNGSAVSQAPCNISVPNGGYLVVLNVFYDTGQIQKSSDPCGYFTTYQYSSTFYGAFPTTITNALGQNTNYDYDFNTGGVTSITDPNLQATTQTYDLMGRPNQVSYPDDGSTAYCYTDLGGAACLQSGPSYQIVTTKAITATLNETSTQVLDGLSRLTQTQLNSDTPSTTYTPIQYDALGRKSREYNPTRCSPPTTSCATETTWGYRTYNYDALNRITSVIKQDSSGVTTSYSGSCTTTTDQAGKSRKSCVDGLGRLTKVIEDPSGLNYETDYQYDTLGNLICAVQKAMDTAVFTTCAAAPATWRPRSFAYDSVSRLTSASNPESGTLAYTYDADGNVLAKTAPKPNQTGSATVVTSYTYDQLNRPTKKSYNDASTPTSQYGYDGGALTGCATAPPTLADSFPIGRRTAMCDASGATSWSHDQMGRVTSVRRTIAGSTNVTKSVTYAPYNLDGSISSLKYPSGRMISHTIGGAGRPVSAVETAHNLNYVTNATYAPHGALSGLQNGASVLGRLTYNSRLQPLQIYYTNGTLPPDSQLQATTCPTTAPTIMGRIYDFGLGVNDNGNVNVISDCITPNRTQNFHYDSLNRMADAYTTGTGTATTNWGEVYTIDPWGNLTNIALKAGWQNSESLNAAAASNKNQLNGFCNDAAGNMTGPTPCANPVYTYDAENRLQATAGYTYAYDGDGKRVVKCNGTYPTCASGTLYWTGIGSDVLAETDWTGAALEEYVFFSGKRVARRDGTGNTVYYYFSDHLGSTTLITSAAGAIQTTSMYYPYGGEIRVTGPRFANNYEFTGKERDSETGLDYFGARHYASNFGRFITPDWAAAPTAVPYAHFGNPQSLNPYGYVENNPTTLGDPDGHCSSWCPKWLQVTVNWLAGNGARTDAEVAHEMAVYNRAWYVNHARGNKEQFDKMTDKQVNDFDKAYQNGDSSFASDGVKFVIAAAANAAPMLGANGTQVTSKTLWNQGSGRIDVENPNPGQRPGQIHYQDGTGKYIYDVGKGEFKGLSATQNRQLLSQPEVQQAIQKGLKYLGAAQ